MMLQLEQSAHLFYVCFESALPLKVLRKGGVSKPSSSINIKIFVSPNSGFHNNNIKAIPENAFVGNPLLQTM